MTNTYSREPYGVIKKNGKILSEDALLQELRDKEALIVELHEKLDKVYSALDDENIEFAMFLIDGDANK